MQKVYLVPIETMNYNLCFIINQVIGINNSFYTKPSQSIVISNWVQVEMKHLNHVANDPPIQYANNIVRTHRIIMYMILNTILPDLLKCLNMVLMRSDTAMAIAQDIERKIMYLILFDSCCFLVR